MERLLITGGSGFIGSAMIRTMRRLRPEMAIRVLEIAPAGLPGVEYVRGSILDEAALERAMRGCTHVAHLAAAVGVASTELDPDTCWLVNERGTLNVFRAASEAGIERLVFASSSEVYGDQATLPIAETCEPRPKSVYAYSKLQGERYLEHFRRSANVDWRAVRFFNVYGPGQRSEFVIPRFVDAIKSGRRPTIYGPGTQVRSFCYVDDAAICCMMVLLVDNLTEWIFNIGNSSEPISIATLARLIIALSGLDLVPEHVPFSQSDREDKREIWNRIPNTERAASLLGFRPRVTLTEGLSVVLAGQEALVAS